MAENTSIEWCHHSFSPWWGCCRVSPGCERCYAETLAVVRRKLPVFGPPKTTRRKLMSDSYWKNPARWNRKAGKEETRFRVFPSMCDPFEIHPDVVEARARLWETIRDTPNLDWLLLTKRPENVLDLVPDVWKDGLPGNVWVGISAENQEWYERRIGHLARIPARLRFVSAEPLLGEIDFGFLGTVPADWGVGYRPVADIVDMVIFGGESNSGARECNLDWIRSGLRQCREAGVAPFVKQMGLNPVEPRSSYAARVPIAVECEHGFDVCPRCDSGTVEVPISDRKGGKIEEFPEDLRVREFPEGVAA